MKDYKDIKTDEDKKILITLLEKGASSDYGQMVESIIGDQIETFEKLLKDQQAEAVNELWKGDEANQKMIVALSVQSNIAKATLENLQEMKRRIFQHKK